MMGIAALDKNGKQALLDINKMVTNFGKQSETYTQTSTSGFKEDGWVFVGDITKKGFITVYQPELQHKAHMKFYVSDCSCRKGCSPIAMHHPGVYGHRHKEVSQIIFRRKTNQEEH